ncbi:hypothetical protein GPAL_1638 [Glaciecola pallidula DSM 14239 = ACAM 615]|uniref:Uncharacterized protein n=1 Tax=Brumicola pallidula DSM 14239 = ACAM 615 TaxID=1121922 RepID=K6ZDT9_9ALTE|nr:hypothetical protein GPAL_1638 [Glaciecola pallidula DSM 14239 = ACAM 615]
MHILSEVISAALVVLLDQCVYKQKFDLSQLNRIKINI